MIRAVAFMFLLAGSQIGYAQTATDADVSQVKRIVSLQQNKIKELEDNRKILWKTKKVPASNSYNRVIQATTTPTFNPELWPTELSFSNLVAGRIYQFTGTVNYRVLAGGFNQGIRWELYGNVDNTVLMSGSQYYQNTETTASIQGHQGRYENNIYISALVKSPGTVLKIKLVPFFGAGTAPTVTGTFYVLGTNSFATLTELPYHLEVDAGGNSPSKSW